MRTYQYYITFLIIISLISVSCASHRAVYPDPVNIQSVIQPGDKVKIVTQDDQEIEFVVTEVTNEAIIGENIVVPLNDIIDMKEETVSADKNALIITLFVAGFAAAVFLAPPAALLIPSAGLSTESLVIFSTVAVAPGLVKGDECEQHYPEFHIGDVFATGVIGRYTLQYNFGYEEAIYKVEYIGIDESICIEKCKETAKCNSGIENSNKKYLKGMETCNELLGGCKFKCIEKGHPVGDIAEHVKGGYYSDGSYYTICESEKFNPFLNIHPTKDKYEKTKWQKDRDECMMLTVENIKPSFLMRTGAPKFFNRSKKYYRECLNERGYNIKLY